MVEMSCEEHDQLAASTQFITHTVGRTLGAMQVRQGLGGGQTAWVWLTQSHARLLCKSCCLQPAATPRPPTQPPGMPSSLCPPRCLPPLPQLQATPIDTKGFQSLLSLVDLTANDSFELYYGLFMYNQVGSSAGLRTCGNAIQCLAVHAAALPCSEGR